MSKAQLICGPVLRRASVDAVYVWAMFDAEVESLTAEVYTLDGQRRVVIGQAATESTQPLKLGVHCYVYLLKLTALQGTFTPDTIYFYELIENSASGNRAFCEPLGAALAYPGLPVDLPSFVLPRLHTVMWQASCRKAHAAVRAGLGVVDQYQAFDQQLSERIANTSARPTRLFLTGDQIYADDVALPMLLLCGKLAQQLFGTTELLPSPTPGAAPFDPQQDKTIDRRRYCNPATGFTSDFAQFHLLTFGEYCAMYLLMWGGVPDEWQHFPGYNEIKNRIPASLSRSWQLLLGRLRGKSAEDLYNEDIKVLRNFLQAAKCARRVMANIPVYMIMDDHDVTDDWNLDQHNSDCFRTLAFSTRVATNALAAGWLFQNWGNDPARFGAYRQSIAAAYGNGDAKQLRWLEEKFIRQRTWWGYTTPDVPLALVLDTRNRRAFDGNKLALMDASAFQLSQALLDSWQAQHPDALRSTLVLVSASPVFGFTAIEAMQLKYGKDVATKIDREPWVANLDALRALRQQLVSVAGVRHVMIFAGDVHYGFVRYQDYAHASEPARVHFWNLTSSAICNIPPGKSVGQAMVASWLPDFLRCDPLGKFRKEKACYVMPEHGQEFITANTNVGTLQLDTCGVPRSAQLIFKQSGSETVTAWNYSLDHPNLLKL